MLVLLQYLCCSPVLPTPFAYTTYAPHSPGLGEEALSGHTAPLAEGEGGAFLEGFNVLAWITSSFSRMIVVLRTALSQSIGITLH